MDSPTYTSRGIQLWERFRQSQDDIFFRLLASSLPTRLFHWSFCKFFMVRSLSSFKRETRRKNTHTSNRTKFSSFLNVDIYKKNYTHQRTEEEKHLYRKDTAIARNENIHYLRVSLAWHGFRDSISFRSQVGPILSISIIIILSLS